MTANLETWIPITGFDDLYHISSFGRVKSLSRTIVRKGGRKLFVPGQIIVTNPNSRGYPRVSLCNQGVVKTVTVHSLVASAFLTAPDGPLGSRRGEYNVNHKDGDKTNNNVDNLEYITNLENVLHARRTGLLDVRGDKHGRSKVSNKDVNKIRSLYRQGAKQIELAAMFGIDQTSVSRIILRQTWSHVK